MGRRLGLCLCPTFSSAGTPRPSAEGEGWLIRPCKPFGLSAEVFEALFLSITYRGDDVEDDLREEVRFVVAPMSEGRQPRTTGGREWHLIPLDPLWVGQPMVFVVS